MKTIPIYLQKKILLLLCNSYNGKLKYQDDGQDKHNGGYQKDLNNIAMVNKNWFEICSSNVKILVDFGISSNYNLNLQRLVDSYNNGMQQQEKLQQLSSLTSQQQPQILDNNDSNKFKFHKYNRIKYIKININNFKSFNYYYINILLKYYISSKMYNNIKAIIVVNNHSLDNYRFVDSVSFNKIYIYSLKLSKDDIINLPLKIKLINALDIGPKTSLITLLKIVSRIKKIKNIVINNNSDSEEYNDFRIVYDMFSQLEQQNQIQTKQPHHQKNQKSLVTPFYYLQSLKINRIELGSIYYLLELAPHLKEFEIKSFNNISSLKSNKITFDIIKNHYFNNSNNNPNNHIDNNNIQIKNKNINSDINNSDSILNIKN